MQSSRDVPLQLISPNSSSERRISPSWTIQHLKARLEPITGIPSSSQKLTLKFGNQRSVEIAAVDEEKTQLANFNLTPHAEIYVADLRPVGMRPNFTDASEVPKYELPLEEYEKKVDSVLAWKKKNKLGRFDPSAPSIMQAKLEKYESEIRDRGIEVGRRCRVGGEDTQRGIVMYVGEVEEIPGGDGKWIGVQLDEPVGKNDGSLAGKRYWGKAGDSKTGVFVRPQRIEMGDFPPLNDLDDEFEEI